MNIESIRRQRLIKITLSIALCLLVIACLQLFIAFYLEAIILSIASFALIGAYTLAQKGKTNLAANGLIAIIFLMLTILTLFGTGLRDTAMFGYPGLIIFAAMTGRPLLTRILLAATVVFCIGLSISHSNGTFPDRPITTNLETGLSMSIIFLVIGYAIMSLHRDLIKTLQALENENIQVRESKEKISYLAHHDALTNLANRALAKERFERAILKSKRTQSKVAVLYLDIDHFKLVNDSLGHQAGDEFLVIMAQRLRKACRNTDTVSRLSGDEFLIIAEDLEHDWQITTLAEKICATINQNIKLQNSLLNHSTSIGIAISPNDGTSFEDITKKADMALYHSKQNGRNQFNYFDQKQQEELQHHLRLTEALKTAIDNNELYLTYQPKINLCDGSIIGAEALLRWQHPQMGLISPDVFIPLAEQSGLIQAIGHWVLVQALTDTADFLALNPEFQMSINVSVAQVKYSNLLQDVKDELNRHPFSAKQIDIEITESMLAEKTGPTSDTLKGLQAMGISISIDDFGTGYSNLGYLKQFNVETLKIDRSFIFQLANNESNQTIVKAILEICKGLGMHSVAEGVEDAASIELLKQWGCDIGQGFFWSIPVTKEAFMELMKTKQSPKV